MLCIVKLSAEKMLVITYAQHELEEVMLILNKW